MEIPITTECRICKSEVKFHDLRQCTCARHDDKAFFCVNSCRWCRASDFSTPCNKKEHETCWERHLPREIDPRNPHEPLDPLRKLYVEAVTYSERDPIRQSVLHEQDRIAQWFTIKSDVPGKGPPSLNVTDRFRHLCNPGALPNEYTSRQFPGFVSFIGDTGMGKSTLLKAMILMGYLDPSGTKYRLDDAQLEQRIAGLRNSLGQTAYGPVSRSAVVSHMTDPTSFGVHLYRDIAVPTSNQTEGNQISLDRPILFADCEGFRAGLALTNAEKADAKISQTLITDEPITANSYGKNGKDGIDLFYARFLYTISDVIVVIMSGDTEVFPDMQRLVLWAASAVYRSVNHLSEKTLIIVRNMAALDDESLNSSETLKESLLGENLAPLWTGSPVLEAFVEDFNKKQKTQNRQIHTNDELLHKFFSKVRCCNIPNAKTAPLHQAFKQYQDLRQQIVQASNKSQLQRTRNWMQYNVPMLSHILNRAFEHFRTSDEPFDFYKAARNDNPNPVSVSDHISNFIRHLQSVPNYPPEMIPKVIAVCLVTGTLRNFSQVREPHEIFTRDLENLCEEGIKKFHEKDQNCGFKFENCVPCVKKRSTHQLEHCGAKGNRVAGVFDESEQLSKNTVSTIHGIFMFQYRRLCTSADGTFALPSPNRARLMRQTNMQEFKQYWRLVKSNKTCLACLEAVPDHKLKCGHCFCDRCVQELGRPCDHYEYGWAVEDCVLCQSTWPDGRNLFRLHPACAGVRALTLDGGGIRGIVEISLLEKILAAIELEGFCLRDCFDIIVGTSTGGIIALGLATLDRDVPIASLKRSFLTIATETFKERRGGLLINTLDYFKITSTILLVMRVWNSVYRTAPLRKELKQLFSDEKKLFSSEHRDVRVAVTSSKDNGADRCLITNYNRPAYAEQDVDFEREDEDEKEMKIWEAALATASAPFYFKKFEKLETGKNYVDGALHANFPVRYTLEEITRVWQAPQEGTPSIDILLSIGTGLQDREIEIPPPLKIGGFEEICKSFHYNLDCHRQWQEFERVYLQGKQLITKIHRLNARINGKYVALDHYKSMERIQKDIDMQTETANFSQEINNLARLLIANLFFFEPSPTYRDSNVLQSSQSNTIPGTIRCRLARGSVPLQNLMDIIDSFWYKELHSDKGLDETDSWIKIPLSDPQRNKVRTQREWLRVEFAIAPIQPLKTQQIIGITLKRWGGGSGSLGPMPVPISGFPVEWRILQQRARRR